MSTNELNSYLNSFDRPQNFNDQAWNQLLEQSRSVWNKFLDGEDWKESLNITCKEAYLMLVNSEGKLIIKDDSLLNYVKNETTEFVKWFMWLHKEMPELRKVWEKELK